MPSQTIQLGGKAYVVVPRDEYEELQRKAKVADLPPLPKKDADGLYPAREYARISMAREVIIARAELGMTQRELAKRAKIRVETLCRLESGQTVPSLATVEKIERALQAASVSKARQSRSKPRPT